ncbi:MAG: hypothetical protein IJQ99_04915 [Synergistaceae bacterium]|nr:hypothetical protein [Synergistaceae bacterium]
MRKIFLTIVIILTTLILSSVSFGAVSEDMNVYVRQDVFDAKMEALFERLHGEMVVLSERMDKQFAELRGEIKGEMRALSARIDGLEHRIGDVHNFLYWLIVLFGIILVLPFVNKIWDKLWESRSKPSFTLDDVKRLIAEAQLNTKTQI